MTMQNSTKKKDVHLDSRGTVRFVYGYEYIVAHQHDSFYRTQ